MLAPVDIDIGQGRLPWCLWTLAVVGCTLGVMEAAKICRLYCRHWTIASVFLSSLDAWGQVKWVHVLARERQFKRDMVFRFRWMLPKICSTTSAQHCVPDCQRTDMVSVDLDEANIQDGDIRCSCFKHLMVIYFLYLHSLTCLYFPYLCRGVALDQLTVPKYRNEVWLLIIKTKKSGLYIRWCGIHSG